MSENKFNWTALFFPAIYYAGREKFKKGLVMALIGFMPVTLIAVGVYAGLKANRDLTATKFNWLPAIGMVILQVLIMSMALNIIRVIKN